MDGFVIFIIIGLVLALLITIGLYKSADNDLCEIRKYCHKENEKNKEELRTLKEELRNSEEELKKQFFRFQFIKKLLPQIDGLFKGEQIVLTQNDIEVRTKNLFETVEILRLPRSDKDELLLSMQKRIEFLEASQSNLSAIPYMASIMSDYDTYEIEILAKKLDWGYSYERSNKVASIREIRADAMEIAQKHYEAKYKLDYLLILFPELNEFLNKDYSETSVSNFKEYVEKMQMIIEAEKRGLEMRVEFLEKSHSNLTAIPYMSAIMSDYETYSIESLAKQLDWGADAERAKKVASVREIRQAAKEMVEKNLNAKYQLAYLLNLFPALEDVIETDYDQLPIVEVQDLSEYDKTRDWLSKEEYQSLSTVERNQLALDRYRASRSKSKWQIGRDYEMYVGFVYTKKGYSVNYFGSTMGLKDLGRDLIVRKGETVAIIQCKYWSQEKTIHEKHIMQLYGTMTSYKIENNLPSKNVRGILITNICLSDMAKKMADYLKIKYVEKFEKKDYPCIKCNIGKDEQGQPTKIYHLPFDQQYDSTQIKNEGEFFAMTVKEAEDAGFRRAFKWFGNNG